MVNYFFQVDGLLLLVGLAAIAVGVAQCVAESQPEVVAIPVKVRDNR